MLNLIDSDYIVIVKWGEYCEWSEEVHIPEGLSCYAVDYVDIIETTFKYSHFEPIDDLTDFKNSLDKKSFYGVKNQYELMRKYDDIILVSNDMAKEITPGSTALIDFETLCVTYRVNNNISYYSKTVSDGNILPVVDGCLIIPKSA